MIVDNFGVTELSRLLKKSRPTVYKYVTDYKAKRFGDIPGSVKELFDRIESGAVKSEIYAYCEDNFLEKEQQSDELKQIINLIVKNENLINFEKLKNFIEGEIENARRTDD